MGTGHICICGRNKSDNKSKIVSVCTKHLKMGINPGSVSEKKIFIIGSEDELKRFIKTGQAKTA